ncbi:MAG: hypothetical protein QOD97_611 [Mycobacterium sp.]|nr:hypothetical protein [Mycobacterium sp.]
MTEESKGPVTEEAVNQGAETHEPVIKVIKGKPTDEEVAALMTVLAGASGGAQVDRGPQVRDLWGHPVDKLRYATFSWERVTQVERTHIRR